MRTRRRRSPPTSRAESVPLPDSPTRTRTGAPGVTGYADGRPAVREVFGYWPTLIDRGLVQPNVTVFTL